jgi:DNA-binding Lrp family transcriptional regulator
LENVFVGLDTKIRNQYSEEQFFDKPKRIAFIFITTESDTSHLALEDLRKIDAVKEVYLSHGVYDLVVKVSGESFSNLQEIVQSRIKNLSNIRSTLILTVI